MARDQPVLDESSSTRLTGEQKDTDGFVNRRSYLKLTGSVAAATSLGLASNSASASVGTEPAAYLDSADDYNHVSFDGNWEQWFTNTHGGYTSTTTNHSRDGNALRVRWPAGEYYGATMEYLMLQNHGYQPDAGHVRYWVYFPDDWQFDSAGLGGTKLPGFAGTYQTGDHDIGPGGYGGRPADGTNGWSARVFNCRPDRAGGQGPIALGSQVYHAGDGGRHGAHPKWNGALDTGTWHRIDQYVEMNTPGQTDGVYRSWIDGDLALEMEGLYFRDTGYGDVIGIQALWAMFYFGGDWGSPVDQHMLFDDLELWLWRDRSNLSTDGSRTDEESEAEEDDDAESEGEYEERFSYKSGTDPTEYRIYVDGEIVQHVWGYATHNDDVEISTVEIDGTEYQVVDAAIEADTWNGYHFNGEVVAISADHEPDELWITGQQISIDDYPDSPGEEDEEDEDEYEERFSYKSGTDPTEYRIYVDGDIVQHVWGYATHNDDVDIDTVEIDGTEYQVVDAAIEADTWNGYHFNGEVVAISADHEPDELWITGQRISIDDYPDSPGTDAGDDSEDGARDDTDDEQQDDGDSGEENQDTEEDDEDTETDDEDTETDDGNTEDTEEDDGDTETGDQDTEEDDEDTEPDDGDTEDTEEDDEDTEPDDGDTEEDDAPTGFDRDRWRTRHAEMSELFQRLFS